MTGRGLSICDSIKKTEVHRAGQAMILGPCVALALIFIPLTKIPNILSIRKVPITYTPPLRPPLFYLLGCLLCD